MANNYIVNGVKFEPFSFSELLEVVKDATQAQLNTEAAYENLLDSSALLNVLTENPNDKEQADIYNNYISSIKESRDKLIREGLTGSSRSDFYNIRNLYRTKILPIEQNYKKRQDLIDEQRKNLISDPSLMYDIDFRTVPLGDLIANPSMSYSPVSGNDLYKQGKEIAISASSRILSIDPALLGQYWRIRQGYGADAANQFLLNQSNIPELKDAIDRIISQYKISKDNIGRATDYIINGMMAGLPYKESYQANRGYVDPVERERLNLAREKFEWTKDKWKDEQLGVKLPNGDRVKDVGGGRVRITHPDGTVEIMAAPKATNATKGLNKDKKAFPGLQFKMWNESKAVNDFQEGLTNSWSYKRKGFSTRDEELISYTDLSPAMQTNLRGKLAEYGLTFNDVEIWRDRDILTDNHYQVRLKPDKEESQDFVEGFGDL